MRGRFGSAARNHQLAAFSENTTQKHTTVRTQYIHTYVYIVVDVFDDYVFDCYVYGYNTNALICFP